MTADEIMLYVDTLAVGYTMEEKIHLKRFFLHQYCSTWMPIRAIAIATGLKVSSKQMVYRSIKMVQSNRQYWVTAHQINHAIKKRLPKLK